MKTRSLILIALFAAITAVFAQIVIPLPFTPVPFTMSLFAVFLTGAVLEKKAAFAVQMVYLLLGLVGVPVFGGFTGGPGILFGVTGGYLVAYPLMSFLTAWIPELLHRKNFGTYILGMLAGLVVCYVLGTVWLAVAAKSGLWQAVLTGVAPFVLLDLVKVACSAGLGLALGKALKAARLA